MKSTSLLTLLLSGLFGLLSSGCYSPNSHGEVYRQWSKRMAEMGIFPVYPPREDVVVGDVYALPLHPYDTAAVGYLGGLGNAGIHVDYLGDKTMGWTSGLPARMEGYYQTRPYPADSTNNSPLGTNVIFARIPGHPDPTSRTSAFTTGSLARLRQVSFPDFNISHVDQESLSAVIPIEGIMASMNFNRSDIQGVHFSIPQAESYGLTTAELLAETYTDGTFTNVNGKIYMEATSTNAVITVVGANMAYGMFKDVEKNAARLFNNNIPLHIRWHLWRSVAKMKDHIYLALISEVYFARSIDITLDRKVATGGGGAARPISTAELGKMKEMGLLAIKSATNSLRSGTNTTTTGSATNTTVKTEAATTTVTTNVVPASTNMFVGTSTELISVSEGDTAFSLADKLRKQELPATSVENIGGSFKFLNVTASSIGMRRTFERPICVGVRGVLLKVNVKDPVRLDPSSLNRWLRVNIGDED